MRHFCYRYRVGLSTLLVGLFAAAFRFPGLGYPKALVFDEVYYARGAYSLLVKGYEAKWEKDEGQFAAGDFSQLGDVGDYVVHPPLGKWLIAGGMELAGTGPLGYRLGAAIAGTITAMLLVLIVRQLLHSTVWGVVAGTLLAVDGQAIVMSRTAILDGFLALFIVVSFGLLIWDRTRARRKYRSHLQLHGASSAGAPSSPRIGPRYLRWLAIITLGLATGIKWSALYMAAAFLVLSVIWDWWDRRDAGFSHPLRDTFWRSAVPGFLATMILLPAAYLATWASWFLTPGSYHRNWAELNPDAGVTWLPDALRSLWQYHQEMFSFHEDLTSPHPYDSHPLGWIIQLRPTAFYFEDVPQAAAAELGCHASRCVSAIHALGHPAIWVVGVLALIFALYRLFRFREQDAFTVLVLVASGWLPWLAYSHRTIFTFYTVVMAPFVVIAVTWLLRTWSQATTTKAQWLSNIPTSALPVSARGLKHVAIYLAIVLALAAFFLPIWTGAPIPFWYWQIHMWLPTWV